MLSAKQLEELREHLAHAANPLFYYDNDADGLCSFLILRRYIGRGKGVAVRSFPELAGSYARKAQELSADAVFILDKPVISREFVAELSQIHLPVIWIDHHDLPPADFESEFPNLLVYNPARLEGANKSFEPTTYLSYAISARKEDMWLAMMGCIADHHLPDFSDSFSKKYSEFWGKVKDPFDAYYGTEIGKIARALNFGLKDSVSNVVRLQQYLITCAGPGDVLAEHQGNYAFRKKYYDVKKKYDSLLGKAAGCIEGKLLFFTYAGDLSISADLSNELSYHHPTLYIAVSYKNGAVSNVSLRGKNVKKLLVSALSRVSGSGGGHEDAVGARIATADIVQFKEALVGAIADD